MSSGKQVLWWGRSDPAYSRNGVLRRHLAALGWTVRDFRPAICAFGDLEAALRRLPRPDLVWVPCFRQRDMAAARRQCRCWGDVPLVFDPLISAYDKQVWERFKLKDGRAAAQRLLAWERDLFAQADRVLADTTCHAAYFENMLGVARGKLRVVCLGADETLFTPAPQRTPGSSPVDVLFYGGFIPLHGAQTIIEAARLYQGPPVRWSLLGEGPTLKVCRSAAAGLGNVFFEDRIPYAQLSARIHRADILLGVFGTTQKAGRVIPNKVCQALACGRPVVTRASDAYPAATRAPAALCFVPPGDARALAAAVAVWAADREGLARRGTAARDIYEACFSAPVVRRQLEAALAGL
jgi:glycosyltransferase involved in cell wall biosynthesis